MTVRTTPTSLAGPAPGSNPDEAKEEGWAGRHWPHVPVPLHPVKPPQAFDNMVRLLLLVDYKVAV